MANFIYIILSNFWLSLISFFIWVVSIVFMVRIDLRLLKGRGSIKMENGKFENWWITFIKTLITGLIIILSFIFSVSFLLNIAKYSYVLFVILIITMLIASSLVVIPVRLMHSEGNRERGLRWLIDLVDKWDEKHK